MGQNLIPLALTEADFAAIAGALATLEEKLGALISLNPDEFAS